MAIVSRLFLTAIVGVVATTVSAQVTPNGWRGPERNGIYPENGLLKQWPADGPALKWEVFDAGKGYSSPVVVDDRVYITGMSDDQSQEIFSAYTLDGKKLYSVPYSKPWDGQYPETRTTPTIDNGKAYLISGAGQVVCLSIANGKILCKGTSRCWFRLYKIGSTINHAFRRRESEGEVGI